MPFVPDGVLGTSICVHCYLSVIPKPNQTIREAELEHVCGQSYSDTNFIPPTER